MPALFDFKTKDRVFYLEKEELLRQIEIFKEMGLGGFHMHVRTGMSTKYLSDEFMGLVDDCVKKAKKEEKEKREKKKEEFVDGLPK